MRRGRRYPRTPEELQRLREQGWSRWNPTPEAAEARSKGGKSTPREIKVEQGKQTAALRFRCDECGLVTNPLALGGHQAATGHVGKSRV